MSLKNLYYILVDGKVIATDDIQEWGLWYQNFDNRRIAVTQFGNCIVSTVFLGLDHNYFRGGDPILWETLVSGGELDNQMLRYSSQDAALKGHKEMSDRVRLQNWAWTYSSHRDRKGAERFLEDVKQQLAVESSSEEGFKRFFQFVQNLRAKYRK